MMEKNYNFRTKKKEFMFWKKNLFILSMWKLTLGYMVHPLSQTRVIEWESREDVHVYLSDEVKRLRKGG
jgi:hypothetical protein